MNTLKLFAFLVLVTIFLCGSASAEDSVEQNKNFGLGIILGNPTGISGKFWIGKTVAIDGAMAWSTGNNSDLNLHLDYLIHNLNLFKSHKQNFVPYFGIGPKFKVINNNNKDEKFGVRFPLGVNYVFRTNPFDVFFEIVPVIKLIPDTEFDMDAGLGVRYLF